MLGMVRHDGGEPSPLQQGDLGGGVAGRHGAYGTSFQHGDPTASAGEQQRSG